MKISIVTVSYNAEHTIAETLRSVAEQDWPDLEHILVDGASEDRTLQVARQLAHPRLRIISEPDDGLYDAMNKGLNLSTGSYVGFLNADDFLASPKAAREIAEAAVRSDADCVLGDTRFVAPDGTPVRRLYSSRKFRKWWIRLGMMPPHPSFYAKRELLVEAGGFDTRYKIAADFDLVARLMLKQPVNWTYTDTVLTYFRAGGVSSGLSVRRRISSEIADSLARLGSPCPRLSVLLRYPMKLSQYDWRTVMPR